MPPLLPRFYARTQEREDARRLDQILLETGETSEPANGKPLASADGHDWQRRRGLPLIGRGVGGVAPGTSPLGALLRKEQGRRPR